MPHRHYHEVEGRDPEHCGRQLGLMFGGIVRRHISEARSAEWWTRRKRRAASLLRITTEYFPSYVRELGAYAAAANVALLDLWTMSIEDELSGDGFERCTTVVTNGGRLIGHNEDWDSDSADEICILKKKCGDVTTLELYYYACPLGGAALSICSSGCIQAINSLRSEHRQAGVPKVVLARRFSELRNIGMELRDLLTIPRSSGFAHNLVDRAGRLTLIEAAADRYLVHQPRTPFVHTNHAVGSDLGEELTRRESSTFTRHAAASQLVSASMTRSRLACLLSNTSHGRKSSIFNRNTIARGIVDLHARAAWFWLRREPELSWVRYNIDFLFAKEPS